MNKIKEVHVKTRRLAGLAALGLVLAGCSHPSEAAEVNGRAIDIDTVGVVNDELREAGLNVTPATSLTLMISERATASARADIPVASDPQLVGMAEQQLGLTDLDYSDETKKIVDFYAFVIASQNALASPEEVAEVSSAIQNADVEVNPRFGTWEGQSGQLMPGQSDYLITPKASPLPR